MCRNAAARFQSTIALQPLRDTGSSEMASPQTYERAWYVGQHSGLMLVMSSSQTIGESMSGDGKMRRSLISDFSLSRVWYCNVFAILMTAGMYKQTNKEKEARYFVDRRSVNMKEEKIEYLNFV